MSIGAAWLADPTGAHELRYWDGTRWTEHVSDAGRQSTDAGFADVPSAELPVEATRTVPTTWPPPQPVATVPPGYQAHAPAPVPSGKKVPAGICGILVGALGIHKFILGYTTEGLVMLLVSVLTCGLGAIVMAPIGFIEGIIYLTKTDAEFDRIYVENKRGWF